MFIVTKQYLSDLRGNAYRQGAIIFISVLLLIASTGGIHLYTVTFFTLLCIFYYLGAKSASTSHLTS